MNENGIFNNEAPIEFIYIYMNSKLDSKIKIGQTNDCYSTDQFINEVLTEDI